MGARPHATTSQIHAAGADDHRRYDRRRALSRSACAGVRLRARAQRRGARAGRARRRRRAVRRARVQRLSRRRRVVGDRRAARRDRRAPLHDRCPHLLRLRHQGEHRLEGHARQRMAPVRADVPSARTEPDRSGIAGMREFARAAVLAAPARGEGRARGRDRRGEPRRGNPGAGRGNDPRDPRARPAGARPSVHELRHGRAAARHRAGENRGARRGAAIVLRSAHAGHTNPRGYRGLGGASRTPPISNEAVLRRDRDGRGVPCRRGGR